jgi:hypothetical protein
MHGFGYVYIAPSRVHIRPVEVRIAWVRQHLVTGQSMRDNLSSGVGDRRLHRPHRGYTRPLEPDSTQGVGSRETTICQAPGAIPHAESFSPSNPNSICSTALEVGCATPYWHRVTFALLRLCTEITFTDDGIAIYGVDTDTHNDAPQPYPHMVLTERKPPSAAGGGPWRFVGDDA